MDSSDTFIDLLLDRSRSVFQSSIFLRQTVIFIVYIPDLYISYVKLRRIIVIRARSSSLRLTKLRFSIKMDLVRLFGFRGNDRDRVIIEGSFYKNHPLHLFASSQLYRKRGRPSRPTARFHSTIVTCARYSLVSPNASDPELASRSVSISEPDSVNRIQLHDLVPKRLPRASF